MSEYLLLTKNLTKQYKGQIAVNNISLSVPRNCIYGLLGPNGAGKSTTLKMITGTIRPTKGEIFYNNKPWNRSCLSEIGAMIESPPIYNYLSAYENLKVRTTVLGIPNTRIAEVTQLVGLDINNKKKAGQFSTGMKQRLGIALALINNPNLLILDEPTNGLDPIGIQQLRELIRSFPKKGITVILSSHLLSEIEQTVNIIGIIANGKLCYEGDLPENSHKLEVLFTNIVRKEGDKHS